METCVAYYELKVKQLLEKLLDSRCSVKKIDVYLDKLLSHGALQANAIFAEWLAGAVGTWSTNRATPGASLASFALNVASALARNEEAFCALNSNNFYIKLINVVKARQADAESSLKLAYIQLLSTFLEHKSGIEWMIASVFCKDVLELSLKDEPVAVVDASRKFMAKNLEKTIHFDKTYTCEVVRGIMLPLSEKIYKSIKSLGEAIEISDEIMFVNLRPTLQLIGSILEYFLEGILLDQKDFRIPLIFLTDFHLEERISDLMLLAKNKRLTFDVTKIMLIMQFLELYVAINSKKRTVDATSSVRKIKEFFISTISKGSFEDFSRFYDFGQLYWAVMNSKIPQKEATFFQTDLALMQLFPNSCLLCKYYQIGELEDLLDDLRESFVQKVLKTLTRDSIRVWYHWRDDLVAQPNLFELGMKSLSLILSNRKYYRRESAVMIFQTLVYSSKDIMQVTKDFPQNMSVFSTETRYFCLLFESLTTFIEEFKISWRDGFEAVNVTNVAFDYLALPDLPSEIVVEILKLADVCLSNYMCPNLALLIGEISDPTIVMLGPLLYLKLLDGDSEVRKIALEVVSTIARISSKKFPSLQKLLIDSELPSLVAKLSQSERETSVKIAAIKCLREMVQVKEIWIEVQETEILEKMRDILFNETERIVRVETAAFMCIAYEHRQFPVESLKRIYETMIHSSTADPRWEVNIRALNFWDQVIKNHLQNQGMIDGSFPEVTFSREHRKIIKLTDTEIGKRLRKVLDELSSIGCLNVLIGAIQNDNIEVAKTALQVTRRLTDLFEKYNIYCENEMVSSPSSGVASAINSPSLCDDIEVDDDLINELLDLKDVCVSNDVCSPSDYGSICCYDIQTRQITPNEFLRCTQQNLDNVLATKNSCLNEIEELDSLLDVMLKICDTNFNENM